MYRILRRCQGKRLRPKRPVHEKQFSEVRKKCIDMRLCNLQYALTFFVTPNHGVAVEAGQVPVCTQSEVVLGPLEYPRLVDDATR